MAKLSGAAARCLHARLPRHSGPIWLDGIGAATGPESCARGASLDGAGVTAGSGRGASVTRHGGLIAATIAYPTGAGGVGRGLRPTPRQLPGQRHSPLTLLPLPR